MSVGLKSFEINYEPKIYKSVQQGKLKNCFESDVVYNDTPIPSFQEFFPKMKNKFGYRNNGCTTAIESLSDFQIAA